MLDETSQKTNSDLIVKDQLENDRFFEKIVFGRSYIEVPNFMSRICGPCSVAHNIAAAKAIESACNITPSEQTKNLRRLMLCGHMIQNHSFQLYSSLLPSLIGASSIIDLQKDHLNLFQDAVKIRSFSDSIVNIIGGRTIHPVTNAPGGFRSFPTIASLRSLLGSSEEIIDIAKQTISLFQSFDYPKLSREIIYGSLASSSSYSYYDGKMKTSNGISFESENYKRYLVEELKPSHKATFGTLHGKIMMVGPVARVNNNRKRLGETTLDCVLELNIKNYLDSPFDSIIARALEMFFFVNESIRLIKYFCSSGLDVKDPIKPARGFSSGVGACESAEGTLFHSYKLDKDGFVLDCNIVPPDSFNLSAMDSDLKILKGIIKDLDKADQDRVIKIFKKSYNLCAACSIH